MESGIELHHQNFFFLTELIWIAGEYFPQHGKDSDIKSNKMCLSNSGSAFRI